ncbi:MAG: hypothetical protein R3292_02815 [Alcanivorax sp.]|nr:hypothetical protein [Alcanivorax sp.]
MKSLFLGVVLVLTASFAFGEQQQDYKFGLSWQVVDPQQDTVTDWLLQQQRETPVPDKSELPAQLYVDSQRRISDTFKEKIPETLQDKASAKNIR